MRLVRSVHLKVEGEESEDEAGGEEDPECEPGGGRGVVQLHAAQPHQPAQQPCSVSLLLKVIQNLSNFRNNQRSSYNSINMTPTCVEAEHEEPDVLHEHGDQPEQQTRRHRDGRVTPLGQHLAWIGEV